jgi:glycosyltransferase involved in cell wall biosynthesis
VVIVNVSYNIPKPNYSDPQLWLERISFSVGVLEAMTTKAEIHAIYNISYQGETKRNGVFYHFPGFSRWQLLFPIAFHSYLKALRPDVVIVHGLIFPWQVIMLKLAFGKPLRIILQHHAERPLKDFRQFLQRWADRYIHAYMFASKEQGDAWIRAKQIAGSEKVKEIMGTSSYFRPMSKSEARQVSKIAGEKVFLWVGRLDANKDPVLLIRAFGKFALSHPHARLYMVYQTYHLEQEVKLAVLNSDARSQISLVGKVDHGKLHYWYNSADFIVSTSHYEGSGIAVCEGMSCGCIPVLTDIPSFRMMTSSGTIGLLFSAGDQRSLEGALEKAMTLDVEIEKSRVIDQFERELSFEANARKIFQIIN